MVEQPHSRSCHFPPFQSGTTTRGAPAIPTRMCGSIGEIEAGLPIDAPLASRVVQSLGETPDGGSAYPRTVGLFNATLARSQVRELSVLVSGAEPGRWWPARQSS